MYIKTMFKLLVSLMLLSVNSYILNNPINIYKKNYKNNVIKVYEPKNNQRKNMTALVFYSGANAIIPSDVYSDFINTLNNYNYTVAAVTNDNQATLQLLYDIKEEYKELIPITHSSGFVNALQTIQLATGNNITKAIFLDPVDNLKLINKDFFLFFKKTNYELNNLKNILVLNAKKSYEWSTNFPDFSIPFIPAFALDLNELEKNNPKLTIEKIESKEHGHSDVLNSIWSDLMHVTLSKGNEVREQEMLNNYYNWLAEQIYNFINEYEEELNDDLESIDNISYLPSDYDDTNNLIV